MNRPQSWAPQAGTWRSQAHAGQRDRALPPQLPCVFSFCAVTRPFLPRALQEGSPFRMKCLVKRLVGSEWPLGLKVTFSLVFSVDFSALWKLHIPSSCCWRLCGPLHMAAPSHCTPSHQTRTPARAHPGPLTAQRESRLQGLPSVWFVPKALTRKAFSFSGRIGCALQRVQEVNLSLKHWTLFSSSSSSLRALQHPHQPASAVGAHCQERNNFIICTTLIKSLTCLAGALFFFQFYTRLFWQSVCWSFCPLFDPLWFLVSQVLLD